MALERVAPAATCAPTPFTLTTRSPAPGTVTGRIAVPFFLLSFGLPSAMAFGMLVLVPPSRKTWSGLVLGQHWARGSQLKSVQPTPGPANPYQRAGPPVCTVRV